MKSSIGRKILIVIFIPFMIIFSALSAYIAYTITLYATDWTELELKGISEINAADLEGRMYSVEVSVMSAADSLDVLDPQSENAREQADRIVMAMFENRHIYNSWFAFEENAFDGKDSEYTADYPGAPSGRFIRSYILEGDEIVMAPDMDEQTLDDPDESPWYVIPRDTNHLYVDIDNEIPNLYDYGVGDEPVYTLSIVAPLHKDGRVIGCVGADVLFDDMTFGIGDDRQAAVAVFYPNGRIFYSQDLEYAEENIGTLGFLEAERIKETISMGKSLFLPDEYSIFLDAHAFTYFQPIYVEDSGSGSLYLYVAIPRAEAFKALMPMFLLIAAIFAVVLAVIAAMYLYVSSSISRPIRKLTLAADAISQGDIETEITYFSDAKGEFGLLSRSLHRMVEQFRVYIIRLEQAQTEMSVHTQIWEYFRNSGGASQTLGGLSAMLCRHLGIFKAAIVTVNSDGAYITASYESDGEVREADGVSFLHHSQVAEMIAGRKVLFLNSFAIAEQNARFTDARTLSVCVVPLRTADTLHGYIILENSDKNKSFGPSEESLLIYVADILADWLSQKSGRQDFAPDSQTLARETKAIAYETESAAEEENTGIDVIDVRESEPAAYSKTIAALKEIKELDVDSAIETMGGLEAIYEQSVWLLARLIPKTTERLDEYIKDDINDFAIEIHGLKGSLNNVGAYALGSEASRIEKEAKSGGIGFCQENYPPFRALLISFYQSLMVAMENPDDKEQGDLEVLSEILGKSMEAARSYDALDALDLIHSLKDFTFGAETDALLEEAVENLEMFNCEKALEVINTLRGRIG